MSTRRTPPDKWGSTQSAADAPLVGQSLLRVEDDRLHPIPLLPTDRVTYVGQSIAIIVAETRFAAMDAAELVEIDYEMLPVVTDTRSALAKGAPLIEPAWGTNTISTKSRSSVASRGYLISDSVSI